MKRTWLAIELQEIYEETEARNVNNGTDVKKRHLSSRTAHFWPGRLLMNTRHFYAQNRSTQLSHYHSLVEHNVGAGRVASAPAA